MNDTTRNGKLLKRPTLDEFENYISCLENAGEFRGVLFYDTQQNINLIQDFVVLDEFDENFYAKETINIRLFFKDKSAEENTQTAEAEEIMEENFKFGLIDHNNNSFMDQNLNEIIDGSGKIKKNYKLNILS